MGQSSRISVSDRKGERSREDLCLSQAVCLWLGNKVRQEGEGWPAKPWAPRGWPTKGVGLWQQEVRVCRGRRVVKIRGRGHMEDWRSLRD